MNQPAPPIEAETFLSSLRDRSARGVSTIALDGGELPVSVHLKEFSSLVFTFTGAVTRDGQPLPQFGATGLRNHVPASFIRLADPSLVRHDEMRLAWYAGHEGFELQKILPDFLQRMIDSLGATRVAFVGGSGGGFAALYYSWQIPNSVAVVVNPQTDLNRYHWGHRRRYRAACWPSLESDAPLGDVIEANLGPLYATRRTNSVVCIQIASDFFHLTRQFAPFVAALPIEYLDWLVVRVANWGVQGHKPAPSSIWIPWVNAALSAPDTTATSIEATRCEQNPLQRLTQDADHRDTATAATIEKTGATRDENIATALARAAAKALLGPLSPERGSL